MPKEQKTEEYLRFGQIVRIHGHKCLQTEDEKQEIRGMITVKGFTDKDAKYTTFKSFKNCQFYRQSLFQILPRGQFDKVESVEEENRKIKEYSILVESKAGEYVKFGEDVVFKHVDSHDYLSGSVRCSDGGLGAFKVELATQLTPDLVFKLQPFRSFQKQGDKIKLQSPLRIKNISNRCYISTEKNNLEKYNIVTTYSRSFTWLIHLHQIHETLSDNDQIRTHDLLFLIHTKNEGYLCLQENKEPRIKLPLKDTGYPFFTSLWEIQKLEVPQISPYNEAEDNHKLGTEGTYSIRQLLNNEYLQVAALSHQNMLQDEIDPFEITIKSAKGLPNISDYLRNKGLIKIGGPKIMNDGQIDAGDQIEAKKEDLQYRQVSPFKQNQIRLSESQSEHGFRIMKIDQQSKNQVLFILSTYEVLDQFCEVLNKPIEEFERDVKSKDLEHIDLTLQKLIAFVKCCKLDQIQAELLPNRKLQYVCMDLKICQKLFTILDSIGVKILEQIYKRLKGENEALKTVFNRAYFLIWQIIKDNPITKIYVCQDWLDIILNHAIQLEEDTVHATLNQILQNNDQVVTKFLKANNNQLVQRIINIFALKPPHQKFLNIFSASCVSGNLPIVGNQNLILNQFLKHLDQTSTFQFRYEFNNEMSELPVPQEGDGMSRRRGKIRTVYIQCYISKDHKAVRRFKEFFQQSGRIDLYQTSNYFIAYLNLLADICYGKNTEAKNHIQQKLAPKKNIATMGEDDVERMTEDVPTILDILVAILQDNQMTKNDVKGNINLQKAVLRLITFAYIESADQNPVLRINRYRNLDQMQGQIMERQQKFFNIMQFIKGEITSFKSFYRGVGVQKEDKKQKQLHSLQVKMRLFTILDLLKSTLINGMWTVEEQQNQILPLLLNILKNDKNDILHEKQEIDNTEQLKAQFIKFKQQVSMATPSVDMIIRCKALACELIQIIFDFRFNNLVTESVAFYKDLYEQRNDNIRQFHKISIDIAKLKSDAKTYLLYNPQLWQQKMAKILDKEDPQFDNLKKAISFLIPLMVELSIHKNSRLFFRSLKILKRHFYSTTDIKNLLLSLSLYDNQNGQYIADVIKGKRRLLNKLEQQSLLYAKGSDVLNPYSQIMNFLAWLSEAIKTGAILQKQVHSSQYYSIFQHFNQQSRIDKFHQRLIKNNDLHPIMLKFLGLSKQPLQTFSDNAKQVLKYVYRFLTLLARNFKQGKKQMIFMIDKVKTHAQQECQAIRDLYRNRENITDDKFLATLNYGSIGIRDDKTLQILRQRNDCEAILLLSQMFNDNKDILYNELEMQKTTIQISEMVNKVPIKNYYKSHILDFFRSLIYYKDKHIIINQSRILAKLQDSKKKDIYYRFDSREGNLNGLEGKSIEDLISEWKQQNAQLVTIHLPGVEWPLRDAQEQPVIIMQELTYFITLMNLFSNLVEGQQTVNIGKCRQVHSYSTLMQILRNASICYPLKAHLRNYVNQLYYSTSIEEDLCVDIIKLELPLLINDLNKLIVILSKQRLGRYYILHPIRYKYFESYIYLYIEQIAYTMNYLLNDNTFLNEIRKQLDLNYAKYKYYLHYFVLRIYERLRWVLNYYYSHKYLRGFLNKITNKMKEVFLIYFKENAFIVFDKSQEKLHSPEEIATNQNQPKKKALSQNRVLALKKRSKKLLHKLVEAEIGNYFTEDRPQKDKNFPLTFFLPYDQDNDQQQPTQKEVSGFQKQEHQRKVAQKLRIMLFSKQDGRKKMDIHTLKLSKLSNELHGRDSFIIFMKSFIQKACRQLYQVDNFSANYYNFSQKFVSFQEYIRIFVEVNTNSPAQIPTDLKIFFFGILLQFIVQHNEQDKLKPIQNWNKYDFESFKQKIKNAQLFLKQSNVAQLLIQTLKHTDDLNLVLSILQFGIAYLLGGNSECQNSLLCKVKQDKKNELFIKIQKIISKLGRKISSKIAELTSAIPPRSDQFIVQPIDRYDYYEQSSRSLKRFGNFQQEKDQVEEESLEKKVFGCLFKFMQLLCECNNIEFKNFIREQIDPDGVKKNASFNILSMTTFQIRRLFKVMDKEASIIVLPLTDFLNQVVTLPCSENQLSLCETTFFEDLCYMASFFTEKANLKQRGFDNPASLQRLFELYQKCILVILNILEGNNPQLNKAFLNKLDVQFLLKMIEKNFQLLNISTDEDLRSLLYDQARQEMHVPVYLQNAINVMIVLLKLQDSEGAEAFKEKKRIYLIQTFKGRGLNLEQLLNSLKKQILKIEIVSTLGKQYLYFPKHPILTKLSDATRNRIMEQVSRSTQRQKIKSLLKFKQQIFTQINHNFKIQKQKFMGIQISPAKIQQLQEYLFKLSYIIILFWSVTTNVIIQYGEVQYSTPSHIMPILKLLDLTQLSITLLYSILYYKCKFVLANYRAKKEQMEVQDQEERKKKLQMGDSEAKGEGKGQDSGEGEGAGQQKRKQKFTLGSAITKFNKMVSNIPIVILSKNDQKFSNVILFFLASFFGTFFDQKLFMMYILYYFMQNQTLQNVFKAITFNLDQLFSVGLLGVVFVYVFCLIFYETYALELMADINPKEACDTIYGCILDLYVSGTIGGSVDQLKPMRFLTDLIYFVFFGLLFGNIVSGIMIDTFAERRAKREQMTDDKKNKCYICGRGRGQLQKNNQKFDDHIHQKHFLWNYIYYLYCLYNKNETQYTGLEYEIRVCVDAGENEEDYIKWIPFGGQESDPHVEKVQELTTFMEALNIDTKNRISTLQNSGSGKGDQAQQAI